jgi:hypothetical protein
MVMIAGALEKADGTKHLEELVTSPGSSSNQSPSLALFKLQFHFLKNKDSNGSSWECRKNQNVPTFFKEFFCKH